MVTLSANRLQGGSKAELKLHRLQQEYDTLKRCKMSYIETSMSEIGLKNLFRKVRQIFSKIPKARPPVVREKTPEELRRERLLYGREQGNKFAEYLKNQQPLSDGSGQKSRNFSLATRKAISYGNYYSERNRLLYKDTVEEYDKEFRMLMMKCALFEKEHDDIRGFLDESILRDTGYRLADAASPESAETSCSSSCREVKEFSIPTVSSKINYRISEIDLSQLHVTSQEIGDSSRKTIGIQVSVSSFDSEHSLPDRVINDDDLTEIVERIGDQL